MKRLLFPLIALLVCSGLAQATGHHYRQQIVVTPVIAQQYVQPLALAACGHAYTAPLAAPSVQVPVIAPLSGTASVTQSYAIQVATAQVVPQPVVQAYTAPAVVQAVTTQAYSTPLAVVGNAYSHVQAVRVAPVLAVRHRLNYGGVQQVVVNRQAVVVDNAAVAVRTRVGGVLSGVGRFLFGRQVETVVAPQRAAIVVPRRAAVQVNAPGVRVRVR